MRRIEWRRLPGAFAKPRRLQVQRSKDGLYFCPIDFCDHNGFYLKEDAGNTPRPSMAGISTLTKNPKLEMIQLRLNQKSFAHLTGDKNSRRYRHSQQVRLLQQNSSTG